MAGYWTRFYSTLFKGIGAMSFKQRWNARKVVNDLRKADEILFKKMPGEIEKEHKVTAALMDEARAMNRLRDAAHHVFKLVYEAEVQEDNLITSINKLRKAISELKIGDVQLRRMEAQLIEGIVGAIKMADHEQRDEYRNVMAIIEEAEKGDNVLRRTIIERFQEMKSQTVLAKWAARFEVKGTAKQIKVINTIAQRITMLKGSPAAASKNLLSLLEEAKLAIKDAFQESLLLQKRALYWVLNVLYNLYLLKDQGFKYVKMNYMPEKPQTEQVQKIETVIAGVLKDFRTIAQGYRIIISHLESGEKELIQAEKLAA